MELVEGGTLKDLTASGPVPVKKLLEISVQIADGLAAAHAAGIVHRDLKPQNVMVSKHGFAKILDFGLAKLVTPEDQEVSALRTAAGDPTRPGMVMGTVGYMSPEQAAGRVVDFRSDQFSFGSIVYELATGKRAFERSTTAETLTAIIREEPDPVGAAQPESPVARALARRALPREGPGGPLRHDEGPRARPRRRARPPLGGLVLDDDGSDGRRGGRGARGPAPLALAARRGGAGDRRRRRRVRGGQEKRRTVTPPSFRELTFQRGEIMNRARFAPDGQTIIYSAGWEGRPIEIFVSRLDSPEARPFGLTGADVLSISASGEMAVALNRHFVGPFERGGMLARIGMTGGGTPREIQDDVQFADWAPDGRPLADRSRRRGEEPDRVPDRQDPLRDRRAGSATCACRRRGTSSPSSTTRLIGDDGGSVAVVDALRQSEDGRDGTSPRRAAWPGRPVAARSGSRRPMSAETARSMP